MPSFLDAVEQDLDQVIENAPTASADKLREAALAWPRLAAKFEAASNAVLGGYEQTDDCRAKGYVSVATMLADQTKVDRRAVQRRTTLARRLATMPVTRAALEEGIISIEHARALAWINGPRVRQLFQQCEPFLVQAATEDDFDTWYRGMRMWREAADPDGADDRARKADGRVEAHCSRTFDGLIEVRALLDLVGGTEFKVVLDHIEREMFEADWAEARERCGPNATKWDLRRTPARRRADALVEMAHRAAANDGTHSAPNWQLYVVQDWTTFCAETGRATNDPGPDPTEPFDINEPTQGPTPPPPPSEADPEPEAEPDAELAADPRGHPANRIHRNAPFNGQRVTELFDGTPIPPSLGLSLGLRGKVRAVVFGPKGNVLHFGLKKDLFDGAVREAIQLRDRWCQGPGCGVPGHRCEIDHIKRRADGGPTDEWNGQCLCDTCQKIKEELVAAERNGHREPQRA